MKASTTEEKVSSLSDLDRLLIPNILAFLPFFDIITFLKLVQKEPLFDLVEYTSYEFKPILTAMQQLSVLLNAEANSNRFRLEGNQILTLIVRFLAPPETLDLAEEERKHIELFLADYSRTVTRNASFKKLSAQRALIDHTLGPHLLFGINWVNRTHYLYTENNPQREEVVVSHHFLPATLQLLANILSKPVRSVTSESKTSTPAEVVYMPGPLA